MITHESTREEVFAAVRQDWHALKEAPQELREDKDLVLATVLRNGRALEYASEKLKGDKEVVLAAVRAYLRM